MNALEILCSLKFLFYTLRIIIIVFLANLKNHKINLKGRELAVRREK